MYLKYCEIKNFRSIKYLKVGFENNFQVLVGLNEAGKSNILKAISFLDENIVPEDDDIRDPRHDENPIDDAFVRFVFGLEEKDTRKIFESLKPKFMSKNYKAPIIQIGATNLSLKEFCDHKKEGLYSINLLKKKKFQSYWSLYGSHYNMSKLWKKVPESWSHYNDFETQDFEYICIDDFPQYKADYELENITVQEFNNSVGREVANFVRRNMFNCIVWSYKDNNLLPGRIDIESFTSDPDTCEPLQNIFYLSGYDDISNTLTNAQAKTNGMRNLLRKLSENTTAHLRKVWPEYKNVSVNLIQNGSVIEAGIEDEFNVYSLDRRSDGFKRFITFLLMISAKVKADYLYDTVIIIDEPDIGLHPSGVNFLREELKKISDDNIVIAASHSIFMVDKDRIDRHLIVRKEKEETTITSDYSSTMLDEEVLYKALGYSLFDLLKKKNIVFEGWTDKYAFQKWLQSTSANKKIKTEWKNIGMAHALGAKDVQRVTSQLEDFDREYVVLTDSDKPSLDWQRKFEGKYKWVTYKDLGFDDKETIEDFLDENYINKVIANILKKEHLIQPSPFGQNSTFNDKMAALNKDTELGKDEFGRLKRMIKNAIFDKLPAKNIHINELVSKLSIKNIWESE